MSEINKRIEALEAELQKLKNEVKEPKMDSNKWYWFGFKDECNKRYLMLFDRVVEKGYFYKYMINTLSEHYFNKENDYISKSNTFLGEATHQEVEDALIKEGEKKIKHATSFINLVTHNKHKIETHNNRWSWRTEEHHYNGTLYLNGYPFFNNGVWADIVKDEPIKIGGYKVKKEREDTYSIGCKLITGIEIRQIKSFMSQNKFGKVSFDGVETDIETINKILAL